MFLIPSVVVALRSSSGDSTTANCLRVASLTITSLPLCSVSSSIADDGGRLMFWAGERGEDGEYAKRGIERTVKNIIIIIVDH